MAVQVSYPGVYVQEKSSGSVSITGAATSVGMFIGMTSRGPMRSPRRILSFTSYGSTFGTDSDQGEMTDQVRQFFLNGGSTCWVMRIARGDAAATVDVMNEFGAVVATFTARDSGKIGESIRIECDYLTSRPEGTFNLKVYREVAAPDGSMQQVEVENHRDLETDPRLGRYFTTVLNQDSNLISATAAPAALFRGISLSGVLGTGNSDNAATASLVARFTNLINTFPGAAPGRFEISVDGEDFRLVSLPAPGNVGAIGAAIDAAVGNGRVAVTAVGLPGVATGGRAFALQFESQDTTARSAVRLRRANGPTDIAAALGLGNAEGGLEIEGGAASRPMPTGIVARLGAAARGVEALMELVRFDRAQVAGVTVTDNAGPGTLPIDTAFNITGPAGPVFDDAAGRSLATARTAIDEMVVALNAAFGAIRPQRWRAARSGFRIVLTTLMTPADAGPNTTLTTFNPNAVAGAFNFATGLYVPTTGGASRVNVRAYRPGLYAAKPFSVGTTAGNDGQFPRTAEYDAAYTTIQSQVPIFNLMVLPRNVNQTDTERFLIWGPASAFCKRKRAVVIVDPDEAWTNVDKVFAGITGATAPARRAGMVRDYAAIFWPRVRIPNPLGGTKIIDPAGTVAGVAARIDASRGVWKASAGLEAATIGVTELERQMSDEENGVINPEAVNCIRAFPNGIVVWGARTMDGFDNSGNTDYRYLPVRRTALFIEESLYQGLKFAVFEPNDEPLWAQIRMAAGAFMNGLFRQSAFAGQKASESYFVKCDAETTTQTDRNLGICNVVVGFAALRPSEFIVITVQQLAGQVQT